MVTKISGVFATTKAKMVRGFSESNFEGRRVGDHVLREKYFAIFILDIYKCPFWVLRPTLWADFFVFFHRPEPNLLFYPFADPTPIPIFRVMNRKMDIFI